MKTERYEADQIVLRESTPVTSIMFVLTGALEVYTDFEGNDFVIDIMYSGSIINEKNFFQEDDMWVNLRCKEPAIVIVFNRELLAEL